MAMMAAVRRCAAKAVPPGVLCQWRSQGVKTVTSDVVVIGGGHEGSSAAIKAAEMGLKATCIDAGGILGGSVPYKALIHFYKAEHARKMISLSDVDLPAMSAQKEKAAACLTKSIECMFRKHGVNYIKGFGKFISPSRVIVDTLEGEMVVIGKHVIIATGSSFKTSGSITTDEKKILSSTGALSLTEIPKRAVVIGACCTGLEIGSVWARLGSDVIIVEPEADVVPGMDGEIRNKLQAILVEQRLKFMLATKVVELDASTSSGVNLTVQPMIGGQCTTLQTDAVLAPECRVPNTEGLSLEKIRVNTDNAGGIIVNEQFMTSMQHVYAIGDVVTARPVLDAHKASKDGSTCVKAILGKGEEHLEFDKVPGVLYTDPEVASFGMTEEQVKATDLKYQTRKTVMQDATGIAKIIVDEMTDKVLGVHILSPDAERKIGDAAYAFKDSDGDASHVLCRTVHGPRSCYVH